MDSLVDFLRGVNKPVALVPDKIEEREDIEPEEERILEFNPFNDEYELIDVGLEYPPDDTVGSWVLPAVYKIDSQDNTLVWQIGYNSITKKLLWTVGRLETGTTQLFTTDVIPTQAQKGSYQKKAYQEASQKLELKIRGGFAYEIGQSRLPIPLPMLANKYIPPSEDSRGNVPDMPVAAQAKFDGIRNIVFLDKNNEGDVMMLTRKMNPRLHFDHVREEAGKLLEFLPPGTILDGELFSPDASFQLISSIAGAELEKHPKEKELQYFIFDLYHPETIWSRKLAKSAPVVRAEHSAEGDDGYVYMRSSGYTVEDYNLEAKEYYELPHEEQSPPVCQTYGEILYGSPLWVVEVRIALLMNAFRCFHSRYKTWPKYIRLVKTYVVRTRDDIWKLFKQMLNHGMEGIMLRHLSRGSSNPLMSLYRSDRSNFLLKVKDVFTTEVVVVSVRPGKGKHKDLAVLTYIEPTTGIKGTVVPPGKHEERREMLLNPDSVKGKVLTVKFQGRMTSGALRFPTSVAFRSDI